MTSQPDRLRQLDFGLKAAAAASESTDGVDALRMRVDRHSEAARSLPDVISAILVAKRQREDELDHDEIHVPRWIEQQRAKVHEQAAKALEQAEQAAAEGLERARDAAREAAAKPEPRNAAEATLLEAKIGNAWTGLLPLLEAATQAADPLKAIELAAESATGSAEKIEALRRFGPDWVTSQFLNQPAHVRDMIQTALQAGADRAELPTLSAVQREGRALLQELERGTGRLAASTREARREIETPGGFAPALAGWDDGAVIPLSHRGQPVPPEAISSAFGDRARAWTAAAHRNYPALGQTVMEQGAGPWRPTAEDIVNGR